MSQSTIVLDTSAYAAFFRGEQSVKKRLATSSRILIPYVVLAELHFGFYRGNQAQENLKNLSTFMRSPRVEVIYPTPQTAQIYGEVAMELANAGTPIQQNDIWIAALCKERGVPLLSLDEGFQNILGLNAYTF